MTVPVRAAPVFAAMLSVTTPSLMPDAPPVTVMNDALDTAVYGQLAPPVPWTVTVVVDAVDGTSMTIGFSVNPQLAKLACDTVNSLFAIVNSPLRVNPVGFAAIVTCTDPLPVPVVGFKVMKVAVVDAVHAHPAAVVIAIVNTRPNGPTPGGVSTVNVQPACDPA